MYGMVDALECVLLRILFQFVFKDFLNFSILGVITN